MQLDGCVAPNWRLLPTVRIPCGFSNKKTQQIERVVQAAEQLIKQFAAGITGCHVFPPCLVIQATLVAETQGIFDVCRNPLHFPTFNCQADWTHAFRMGPELQGPTGRGLAFRTLQMMVIESELWVSPPFDLEQSQVANNKKKTLAYSLPKQTLERTADKKQGDV